MEKLYQMIEAQQKGRENTPAWMIGDGNAVCTRFNNVKVLDDWQTTENTLMCRRPKK